MMAVFGIMGHLPILSEQQCSVPPNPFTTFSARDENYLLAVRLMCRELSNHSCAASRYAI